MISNAHYFKILRFKVATIFVICFYFRKAATSKYYSKVVCGFNIVFELNAKVENCWKKESNFDKFNSVRILSVKKIEKKIF